MENWDWRQYHSYGLYLGARPEQMFTRQIKITQWRKSCTMIPAKCYIFENCPLMYSYVRMKAQGFHARHRVHILKHLMHMNKVGFTSGIHDHVFIRSQISEYHQTAFWQHILFTCIYVQTHYHYHTCASAMKSKDCLKIRPIWNLLTSFLSRLCQTFKYYITSHSSIFRKQSFAIC